MTLQGFEIKKANRVTKVHQAKALKGFSLVEIVVATVIVSVLLTPLYFLFSSSRRMNYTAKNLALASACASSLLSALKDNKIPDTTPDSSYLDTELNGLISLESLSVSKCSSDFVRKVEFRDMQTDLTENLPHYHVLVNVVWESQATKEEKVFSLDTLVQKK